MKSMMSVKTIIGMLVAVMLFATACNKKQEGTARLNVRLTDAPGDYEAVNVDIQSVEVHTAANGWVTLNTYAGVYNLLDFVNGQDTLLATASIPAGEISQIRLILGENNTVQVDSMIYPLTTPSAQQSGLKLNLDDTLAAGVVHGLVLDFDASQSVVETGNGKYILKPVIRVTGVDITSGIEGSVLPIVNTSVTAYNASDTVSTYTDATGNFMIGLAPGTYAVLLSPAAPYADTTVVGVSVVAGSFTNIGVINF